MKKLTFILFVIFVIGFLVSHQSGNSDLIKENRQYEVTKYRAIDNEEILSTNVIQKAIDDAFVAGGGCVYFPKGIYLISPIQLKSNVELYKQIVCNPERNEAFIKTD